MAPDDLIRLEGRFFFDPNDPIYQDHFPGKPVVPGSLILHAFLEVFRQHEMARPEVAEKFRFRKFVTPGWYRFCIQGISGLFRCELYDDRQLMATGTLKGCS